jgi:pimeloyl-ACP methyl ester carboxylesterase
VRLVRRADLRVDVSDAVGGGEPAFTAVGMLGWSGVNTVIQVDHGHPLLAGMYRTRVPGPRHPYRQAFHYDDVPEAIVAVDLDGYPARPDGAPRPPWAATFMPGGPKAEPERPPNGAITAAEAARIEVPVLIAVGERDVCPDPWAEPDAHRGSRDRIVAWARTVTARGTVAARG